jgi:hypothetical protein
LVANKIQLTSFSQASKHHQEINKKLIDLAEILAM